MVCVIHNPFAPLALYGQDFKTIPLNWGTVRHFFAYFLFLVMQKLPTYSFY